MNSASVDPELADLLRRCVPRRLWAEQEEGPYHRDGAPLRRDVTEDRGGAPLQLGILLARADGEPADDTTVDIWHCDAHGRYSGFPSPEPSLDDRRASTFLRGRQHTDPAGMVEFRTIYPGWYSGRTVHIHVMATTPRSTYTSQLYFPDDLTDTVFEELPYAGRPDRDTTNETDVIFPTGGDPALLDVSSPVIEYRAGASLLLPERAP